MIWQKLDILEHDDVSFWNAGILMTRHRATKY